MSSESHEIWGVRHLAARWAGLTAFVLIAGCGGERREAPGAGAERAAVTDTQPMAPADTGSAATADTAAAAPSAAGTDTGAATGTAAGTGGRDTAARQQAQRSTPAAARERSTPDKPAAPATPKPAAPAQAPKPAPAPPAQAATPVAPSQDTAPETTAAQDTGSVLAAEPSQDTASAEGETTGTTADAPLQDTAAAGGETTGTTQTAVAPLRDEYHRAPADTVDQATYDGWKQYNLNCARCHGEDVLGSTIAPHLIMSLKPGGATNTPEAFMQVVCAGRPELGMPSWCALGMEPATINQIYAYVKARSEGKMRPGRPALRPEG